MVTATTVTATLWEVAGAVADPELPFLTIADLGVLRDVRVEDGRPVVTVTPTYSGCPALATIVGDVRSALAAAGHPDAEVRTELAPPWSTDDMTEVARNALAAAGIAPPGPAGVPGPVALRLAVRCPRCGSPETEELSRFGATACKALWRCRSCREPFEHMKAH